MFAKDYHKLNDIYNSTIIRESVDEINRTSPEGGPDTTRVHGLVKRPCLNNSCEEDCEGEMSINNDDDSNASMAKQNLFRIVKMAAMLHDLVGKSGEIEAWVLTKIATALDHLDSVYGYEDYQNYKQQVDVDLQNIEEETEKDLYSSISSGGISLLAMLRKTLATESRDVLEAVVYEAVSALEARK